MFSDGNKVILKRIFNVVLPMFKDVVALLKRC